MKNFECKSVFWQDHWIWNPAFSSIYIFLVSMPYAVQHLFVCSGTCSWHLGCISMLHYLKMYICLGFFIYFHYLGNSWPILMPTRLIICMLNKQKSLREAFIFTRDNIESKFLRVYVPIDLHHFVFLLMGWLWVRDIKCWPILRITETIWNV